MSTRQPRVYPSTQLCSSPGTPRPDQSIQCLLPGLCLQNARSLWRNLQKVYELLSTLITSGRHFLLNQEICPVLYYAGTVLLNSLLDTVPVHGAVDELVGIDYSLLKDPVASTSNLDMEFRVSCPAGVWNQTPSFSLRDWCQLPKAQLRCSHSRCWGCCGSPLPTALGSAPGSGTALVILSGPTVLISSCSSAAALSQRCPLPPTSGPLLMRCLPPSPPKEMNISALMNTNLFHPLTTQIARY